VRDFREIKQVLVAYRGSSCDKEALRFIGPLFAKKKPRITVIHVQEDKKRAASESAGTCLIQEDHTLRELGHEPEIKPRTGDFVEEVLKEVKSFPYDLVVLAAYGHKKPKYLSIISDEALNVVRSTTRPVLVFRDKTS